MKEMKDAPRDGSRILIKHSVHGWIEASYDAGYWTHSMDGDEWNGPVWVCGDDITQIEIEETPNELFEPEALGWLELPE